MAESDDRLERIKDAFASLIELPPEDRSQRLSDLAQDAPSVATELKELMKALDSASLAERISGFSPAIESDSAADQRRQQDRTGQASSEFANSVLQSLERTLDSVPRISLKGDPSEDPIVKPTSSAEVDVDERSACRFRIDGEIARGGMGAIFKGRDDDLGRDLAIKVLLEQHQDKSDVAKRFIEEAQIGGQLQHPGIAPVYELGTFSDNRPFFAMKLVKGQTLAAMLAERKSPTENRSKYLGILEQICQTVAYAHSRGVIHRDLKPSNIMVGAFGEVQVMDWGLAKVLQAGGVADERKLRDSQKDISVIGTVRSTGSTINEDEENSKTRMGSVMGTPAYMSPEQALGEIDRLDERTDVFALGSLLCEILTGKPCYYSDHGVEILRMASRGKTEDAIMRLETADADSELVALVRDCLQLEPSDRLRSASIVSERLSEYLESVETRLRDSELEAAQEKTKAVEERKRRKFVYALAASSMTLVVTAAIGWSWIQHTQTQLRIAKQEQIAKSEVTLREELSKAKGLLAYETQLPTPDSVQQAKQALERASSASLGIQISDELAAELAQAQLQTEQLETDVSFLNRLHKIWDLEDSYFVQRNLSLWRNEPALKGGALSGQPTVSVERTTNPKTVYESAFSNWGIDIDATTIEALASKLNTLPDLAQADVIVSLERWKSLIELDYGLSDWSSQEWHYLHPVEMSSNGPDTFEVLPDQSIFVSGDDPGAGYKIVLDTEQKAISALRLEALLNDELPNRGPGRSSNGVFVFEDLKVTAYPKSNPGEGFEVELADGAAEYADSVFAFEINRWHIDGGGGRENAAYYRLARPLYDPMGFRIEITNSDRDAGIYTPQVLGHFRWSATSLSNEEANADRLADWINEVETDPWRKRVRELLTSTDINGVLSELENSRELRRQPTPVFTNIIRHVDQISPKDLCENLFESVEWQNVRPASVSSQNGTEYEVRKDGLIIAKGPNPESEEMQIVVRDVRPGANLVRLEFLGSPRDEFEGDASLRQTLGRRSASFLDIREIAISSNSLDDDGTDSRRSHVEEVFSDYPFAVPTTDLVDNDEETIHRVRLPEQNRNFYFLFNHASSTEPQSLIVRLVTGRNYGTKSQNNPGKLRVSLGITDRRTARKAKSAVIGTLERLLAQRPADENLHAQMSRRYASQTPPRMELAFEHAYVAMNIDPQNMGAKIAFLDSVTPEHLRNRNSVARLAAGAVGDTGRENDVILLYNFEKLFRDAAIVEFEAGRDEKAIELVCLAMDACGSRSEMITRFPGDILSLGFERFSDASLLRLVHAFEQKFPVEPNYLTANNFAFLLAQTSRKKEAGKFYELAVKLSSQSAAAWNRLAYHHFAEVPNHEKVIETVDEALQQASDLDVDRIAHQNLVLSKTKSLVLLGRVNEAKEFSAKNLDTTNHKFLIQHGIWLAVGEEFVTAKKLYQQALEIEPQAVDAIYQLARIHLLKTELHDLEFAYSTILKLEPNVFERDEYAVDLLAFSRFQLAELRVRQGRGKEALDLLEVKYPQLERSVSNFRGISEFLLECMDRKLRDYQRAEKLARRAIELDGTDEYARCILGAALFRNSKLDEANRQMMQGFQKLTQESDPTGWAHYSLYYACVLHGLGKPDEANELFGEAQRVFNDSIEEASDTERFRFPFLVEEFSDVFEEPE